MRKKFAEYVWLVAPDFDARDPDWSDWQIVGRFGVLYRAGGRALFAIVQPSRARVAHRAGFAVAAADGESYVRCLLPDDPDAAQQTMSLLARIVGFRRARKSSASNGVPRR